jgi:hypothetical protein
MALFSAYLDESGHVDDSDFVVVGGCIAHVNQWAYLEREWSNALLRSNPLKPEFHYADCTDENLRFHLATIIVRRVEKAVAIAIPVKKYKAANKQYALAECLGYPYPLAAWMCLAELNSWAALNHGVDHPIEYVFEDGAKHKGQLEWLAVRDQCAPPSFKKKKECKTLQVGDFIAGEIYRSLRQSVVFGTLTPTSILEKLDEVSHVWGGVDLLMDDPERTSTVFQIPVRDTALKYQPRIMNLKGERRAIVHTFSKGQKNPKLKKAIRLPSNNQPLTLELINARIEEYRKFKLENAGQTSNAPTSEV